MTTLHLTLTIQMYQDGLILSEFPILGIHQSIKLKSDFNLIDNIINDGVSLLMIIIKDYVLIYTPQTELKLIFDKSISEKLRMKGWKVSQSLNERTYLSNLSNIPEYKLHNGVLSFKEGRILIDNIKIVEDKDVTFITRSKSERKSKNDQLIQSITTDTEKENADQLEHELV